MRPEIKNVSEPDDDCLTCSDGCGIVYVDGDSGGGTWKIACPDCVGYLDRDGITVCSNGGLKRKGAEPVWIDGEMLNLHPV